MADRGTGQQAVDAACAPPSKYGPPVTSPRPPAVPGRDTPLVVAVLAAMAGVRRGYAIAVVGSAPSLTAALLAGSGSCALVEVDADVAVAVAAYDVPTAAGRLGPGGRLVALAADHAAAARTAAAQGLLLRHVEPVGGLVAWSAVRPVSP
jgi:hypothetical protein